MSVSTVAVQGRAVVMAVSQLPRGCALCAKKVRPARPDVGVSAKKFALLAQNGPQSAFYGVLGEVFRGNAAGGPLSGEVFRGNAAGGPLPGEVFRGPAVEGSRWTRARHLDGGCVPPLDLGRATDTRSRVCLPLWLPVGASGRRPAIPFPQDSSHFAKNATHPYI